MKKAIDSIIRLHEGTEYLGIAKFLKEHGEGRITQDAYNYFKRPNGPGSVALKINAENLQIIGMSGLKDNNGEAQYSITVTHKDHRNKGIGAELLDWKIRHYQGQYTAIVAADNGPSKRICEKVELQVTDTLERTRSTGTYTALKFEDIK